MAVTSTRPPFVRGLVLTAASLIGTALYAMLRRRRIVGRPTLNAADMLRSDHEKVKALFQRYEMAVDPALKDQLAEDILAELEIHETLENEIFYPAARRATGARALLDLADAQHQQANELIVDIQAARAQGQPYDQPFAALMDAVREHIAEEEGEILPRVEKTGLSLRRLGWRMLLRKQQLKVRMGFNTAALKQDLRQRPAGL